VKLILRFVVFIFCTPLFAQSFSNEWIDYTQSYYSFPISENGIYRITYQNLVDAGISINTINPENIQVFARGKEVPLFIEGESDGVFNTTDYIEFYGEKNDGWLDSTLYKGRKNQPNPYYSLISDTINYFLSWNTDGNNLRYEEENAIDFSNYFKASYIWKEQLEVYNSSYYDGEILTAGITDPEYVPSEGWMDGTLTLGNSRNKTISTRNRYSSGPFVELEAQVAGESNWRAVGNGDHHLEINIGTHKIDRIFEGYELVNIKSSFSPSQIISGNNTFRFQSIDDRNSGVDRTALAYLKITYPQTLSLSNASYYEFLVDDASSQNAQYLEILFFRGGQNPVLYDLSNHKRIRVIETLANYKTIIPNGNGRKRCVIAATNEIKIISDLNPVSSSGLFVDYLDLQKDTSFLIITQSQLIPEASFYAAYRRSIGLESMVIDIEQLYLQYAYGVKKHPLAIRNFVEELDASGKFPISHIFLLGKSVAAKAHRKSSTGYLRNLVPTMGNPAADNLLVSGINNSILEPIAPLGRLSAKNGSDIDLYLDKVKEYESAEPAKWMKRALHFAGGKDIGETNDHTAYLNGFAQDFQSLPQGGQTLLFTKSTSSPFQVSLSDSIRTLMNEGVSLLTFFGHSTANGGFDISIDSPDKLQNQGRYNVLFANSCFAGNTHQNGPVSTSEQYVLERNKGSIAFIASGNLGLPPFLNRYSSIFYENFSSKNYGKSLAENMRLTVQELQNSTISDPLKSICLEMTLQGDPSLVLNAHRLTDYQVKDNSIRITPSEVTTDIDSFKISILIENIGRAINDSVVVQLIREFPINGINDSVIYRTIVPITFEKTIDFSFPVDVLSDIGSNVFTFLVDPFSSIEELSELNNRLDFEVLIRSGEIIPVYPYNYAIVGDQSPTLKASTAFAFEEEKTYRFELDNTIDFNSPSKASLDIASKGGVIGWKPTQLNNMNDSSVYFWRTSKIPSQGEDFNWRVNSFQYLPNESGWSQDQFDQFSKNNYLFIGQNNPLQRFDFVDNIKELLVKTKGSPTIAERNRVSYAVDADIRERASCYSIPAFLIAVLDSLSLDSWESTENDYGHSNYDPLWCFPNRNRSEAVFNFNSKDTSELYAMRDFLNNSIPNGSYVVAYNYLNIDYSTINNIDSSILKAFKNIGVSVFDGLQDGFPFIFSVKKGDKSSVVETSGKTITEEIELKRTLVTSATFGEITSTKVGPSPNFKRLSYRFSSQESNSTDEVSFELLGLKDNGSTETLFTSDQFALDTNIRQLLSRKSIQELRLRVTGSDAITQTPPQLERWEVSYTELPDAALAPNLFFKINKDTLQQGENFEFEVAIQNNSPIDMDSLAIEIKVMDLQQNISNLSNLKLAPLKGDSILILKLSIPTQSFLGKNTLLLHINPELEQLEQHSFNNTGQYDFYVINDRINPLLDVTFDGRHIINREIVSSAPRINISLRDNNQFLALDDTSAFTISLRHPNGDEELLNYNNPNYNLQFIPAQLPENTARVIFSPQLNQDGIYRLKIQASDKTGNQSGSKNYQIEFEVINKASITHLLNYPNPFSTSTQFVFTLTGSEVPDRIQIQIMTITGKVVREISEDELGPIHIGNNITDFKWDGKDEYGDQLANGVYLYRVKMKLNGNNLERRESTIDKYFTKSFGKMYLLR